MLHMFSFCISRGGLKKTDEFLPPMLSGWIVHFWPGMGVFGSVPTEKTPAGADVNEFHMFFFGYVMG